MREKLFGLPRTGSLDGNAVTRLLWAARWMTPKCRATLTALLHFNQVGRLGCTFPSYEAIAGAAQCGRTTVWRSLHILEQRGLLTWSHRLKRVQRWRDGLLGPELVIAVHRTSNCYRFLGAKADGTGKQTQERKETQEGSTALEQALARLGRAIGQRQVELVSG